ncbi:MAG: hypothetical protein WAU07_01575 [Microgenomates group bacterium]
MFKNFTPIQTATVVTLLIGLATVLFGAVPLTDNFVFHTKSVALFYTTLILIGLFLIRSFKRGSYTLTMSPLTPALALMGLLVATSTFLANAYPVDSLLGYGGVYLSMIVIALVGASLLPQLKAEVGFKVFTIFCILLVVTFVTQLVGFGPASILNVLFDVNLPTDLAFSVTGSTFISLQIIVIALVGNSALLLMNKKKDLLTLIAVPTLLLGLTIGGWALLPGNPGALELPSLQNSWRVALDSLETPRAALIGRGPDSYGTTYDRFKPLEVNATESWNLQFTQGSNAPLTMIVTIGLLGFLSWLFIVFSFFQMFSKSTEGTKPLGYAVATSFVLQLLLPPNVVMLGLQAVLLALYIAVEKKHYPILKIHAFAAQVVKKITSVGGAQHEGKPLLYLTFVAGMLLVCAGLYGVGRAYAAEIYMMQSSYAAQRNDAKAVYELQQKAILLNQYNDSFRRRYGQTNLLIAQALTAQVQGATQLSEEEKTQITRLILQAVREARSATVLSPADSANWLALARVYEALIPLSEDAANLSVQAYLAAIQTNPLNPTLRISLSNLLASQEGNAQALQVLDQTVSIKPDFVATHFARAQVLQQLKNYPAAKESYQLVLQLLDPEAPESDRQEVTTRIKALDELIAAGPEAELKEEPEVKGPIEENDIVPSLLTETLGDDSTVVSDPSDEPLTLPSDETPAGETDAETSENSQATPNASPRTTPQPSPAS